MSERRSDTRYGLEIRNKAEEEGAVVLALIGELDLASARSLKEAVRDAQAHGARRLVIDLSQLDFIDSSGLHVLTAAQLAAEMNGHQLFLRRGPHAVQRVFELTRLADHFSFDD